MMNSPTIKLVQASVLLALAITTSSAQQPASCDFALSRGSDGNLTKIQVGDNLALIQTSKQNSSSWKA